MRAKIAGVLLAALATSSAVGAPATVDGFGSYMRSRSVAQGLSAVDVVPIVQGNTTSTLSISALSAYLQANLPIITMLGYTPLAANGDGSRLKNITPAQIGAQPLLSFTPLAANGSGAQLTGITAAQVGALAGTKSGSTAIFATVTGTLTNGHCVSLDGLGNLVDAGAACGSGSGGSGSVASAQQNQIAYYPSASAAVAGLNLAGLTIANGALGVVYGVAANTAAQGNDGRIVGALQNNYNLSDLTNAATARANLGAQAALGYTPLNSAGGTMTGPFGAPAGVFSGSYPSVDWRFPGNATGLKGWHGVMAPSGDIQWQTTNDSYNGTAIPYTMKHAGPSASDSDTGIATTGFVQTIVANLKTYVLALLQQNYTLQVPSAAAMANLSAFGGVQVLRGDVGILYTDTGASCTVGIPAAFTNSSGPVTNAATFSVKSASGIVTGQLIEAVGVPLGTTVSSISGTTITPSANVTITDDEGITFATAGAGDLGWQIQPTAGHCWRADISKGVPITVWGGVDDDATDNQPAFTKAVAATVAAGDGQIIVPGSAAGRCYRINSPVVNANPGVAVAILGQRGRTSCVDLNYASGDGFHWGFPTSSTTRATGGIADITFKFAVMHTAGAAVQFDQSDVTFADRISCLASGFQCIAADDNATNIEINEIQARYEGQTAIALGCNFPNGIAANVRIKGADINYQHRAALELCGASGIGIHDFNGDYNFHSLWAHASSGKAVQTIIADGSDYFDVSSDSNVLLDASQGVISEWAWGNRTWVASSGSTFTIPATNQSITTAAFSPNIVAAGFYATDVPSGTGAGTTGTSTPGASNLLNNRFDLMDFNSGGSGIVLIGGANNAFSGTTTDNNAANASGENAGMLVQSNTYHWSWSGTAGGASGLIPSSSNSHQTHGIYVGAGAGDYYTISGDLTGNVNGGLLDNGTGTHKLTSQILQ